MTQMNIVVSLPSGDVNVPVQSNSTPGHLKENIKYSLGVIPKNIKLTCEGRVLDDFKPLSGEPNNVNDGANIVASVMEGAEVEAAAAKVEKPKQPTMIRKEEPPKPKKPKKEVSRPILGDGDVVKKDVLGMVPGSVAWTPQAAWMEPKSAKRHLAFFRVEAVEDKKSFPEQDDDAMVIALGDPQTSPVWTEVAKQLKVGEKANFALSFKALDFDPEGLNPTEACATWTVELVQMLEVEDIAQDFSQLLHVEAKGTGDGPKDLDRCFVHWRLRRWQAEGCFCIGSSRERIAIMPGYGFVPIEDMNAPPVTVDVGEGQQEGVEIICSRLCPGGNGHLYLKSTALTDARPKGCVVVDVELVGLGACRGPGSEGWQGWSSLMHERQLGDQWLEEADGGRKQLETFDSMKASADQSKEAAGALAARVGKYAGNSVRRYKRVTEWLDACSEDKKKVAIEKARVVTRLAKAMALGQQRFGEATKEKASADEVKVLEEVRALLKDALETAESAGDEKIQYEALRATLHVCIQQAKPKDAHEALDRMLASKPDDDELKLLTSEKARLHRLESELELAQGAQSIEKFQLDLRAAVEAKDKPAISAALVEIEKIIVSEEVKWDVIQGLKVGKDVGNAMKMGEPDIAAEARKVVMKLHAMAEKNRPMWT